MGSKRKKDQLTYEVIAVYATEIDGQLVLVKRYAAVVSPDSQPQFEDRSPPEVDPIQATGYIDDAEEDL